MKRWLYYFFLPIVLITTAFFATKLYIFPAIEAAAIQKIRTLSESTAIAKIDIGDIIVHVLSLSVECLDIKVEILDPFLAENFSKIEIERAQGFLDVLDLFTGQFEINTLYIQKLKTSINVDSWLKGKSDNLEIPVDQIFSILRQIPLRRVMLSDWDVDVESREHQIRNELRGLKGLFSFLREKLTARIDVESLTAFSPFTQIKDGALQIRVQLEPDNLNINNIQVQIDKSFLNLQGQFRDWKKILIVPVGSFKIDTDIDLEKISELAKPVIHNLPTVKGQLKLSGQLAVESKTNVTGEMNIETNSVSIDQFKLGDARLEGKFAAGKVQLSEISFEHPAGKVRLTETELSLGEQIPFKTTADVQSIDLQALFRSLNLNRIPVYLLLQGKLECSGGVQDFTVTCSGNATGKDLRVDNDMNSSALNIVKLDQIAATGSVTVDQEKVAYEADLFVKDDSGKSSGIISYETGFTIDFETPKVQIEYLRNLVGLKSEGTVAIRGQTSGNSDTAILSMKINSPDFTFEDFQLGELETDLTYASGILAFDNVLGKLPHSAYSGAFEINLRKDTISGQFESPQIELEDFFYAIKRKYDFPLTTSGIGFARARFSGPLDIWKMDYLLQSQIRNGKIGPDSYDALDVILNGENGNLQIDRAAIRKGKSKIEAKGGISSDRKYGINIETQNLRLEDSEWVLQNNSQVQGDIELSGKLKGELLSPDLKVEGALKKLYLAEDSFPESTFAFSINENRFVLDTKLFSQRIIGHLQIPFNDKGEGIAIDADINSWDYFKLTPLLIPNEIHSEYDSYASGKIQLSSPNSDWNRLSGKVEIRNLFLRRGDLFLRNLKPAIAIFKNGRIQLQDFEFRGVGNRLQLTGTDFELEKLDVDANAAGELRFFQIMIPNLDDLSGFANLNAHITGSWLKPNIDGTADVKDGFIKITGFPHPIEKGSAQVRFSKTKAFISDIRGQISGGSISGKGEIEFVSLGDIPIQIDGVIEGTNFSVPDKVQTQGRLTLSLSGRWFPYVLSGKYEVSSGLVTKEFGDTNNAIIGVRQSSLLPQFARERTVSQLNLDIQVELQRPLLVKNSQAEGSVTGNLRVVGPITKPNLLGPLQIEKGTRLIFRDKQFDLVVGKVNFDKPDEVNPELYINAQARINQYDVNLLIQGPAKNPNFKLTSIPPLSDRELISLLALGVTDSQLDGNVSSKEQVNQTYSEIGAFLLNQAPINRPLKDTLGIEVQITSSFDNAKNVSVPKANFSRKINKKLNAVFSRALSDKGNNEFKLQYIIDPNLSAVGSWEGAEAQDGTIDNNLQKSDILGLDLEYKRDFK